MPRFALPLLNIICGSCTCSLTSRLYSMYSCPSPMRPHFLQWKSGHIRGLASIEGDNFVVFYHPCASEIFGLSGLIRGVASIKGDNFVVFYHPCSSEIFGWSVLIRGVASLWVNLVVFYYPCASEIFGWSGLIRGVDSLGGQFSSILPSLCI
jgi:hypothetical protein